MASSHRLSLAKVSYAEDPPSARAFQWTHLTQNLSLAVGRWAGLSMSISGQSLGIFQGQSTLITINVEEMVREARYENGAFDKAANSFKPKPSLSAIYLYPALAMSYCTQHNTIRRVQVKFHTTSEFNIVYDFLQRVSCPLSRYNRPSDISILTSQSVENGVAHDKSQFASQKMSLKKHPFETLDNAASISNNSSQYALTQLQRPTNTVFDTQLSSSLNARRVSNFSAHSYSHSAIPTQDSDIPGMACSHTGQRYEKYPATSPINVNYSANRVVCDVPPSTAPPNLSCSYYPGSGGHASQEFENTMERSETSQYILNARNVPYSQAYTHQSNQLLNDNKEIHSESSAKASLGQIVPPRRELPWLRPRPHSSAADLPPLPTPQYAGRGAKREAATPAKAVSTRSRKRAAVAKATPVTPSKSQTDKQTKGKQKQDNKAKEQNCNTDKTKTKASKKGGDAGVVTETFSMNKQQYPKSYEDAGTSTEKQQYSKSYKNASTITEKQENLNTYKDASASTEQQNVVDRICNLLNCSSAEEAATDTGSSDLAAYAHQPAGERAAVVNHMVAGILYDPYFATLCNDLQTYVKGLTTEP